MKFFKYISDTDTDEEVGRKLKKIIKILIKVRMNYQKKEVIK